MGSTKRKSRPGTSTASNPTKHRFILDDRSFYQNTLMMTHKRLGLSQNAITLLKHLDEVRLGCIDEDDLGRKIRLSSAFHKAILDTITHCTDMMVEKPDEGVECAQIVKKCTEMMEISRNRPTPSGFPFFKLPAEIRTRIYDAYFEGQFNGEEKILCQWMWPACYDSCPPRTDSVRPISTNLARTSTRVRDEVLPVFYTKHILSFNCSCTMSNLFSKNSIAMANVRSVRFHWRGPKSDAAIPCLYRCPELKNLIVLVSKMTTYTATKREKEMKKYFNNSITKMSDANGIDELMKIRGLETVSVKQAPGKGRSAASKVTEETVWALQIMLNAMVMERKPDDYGQ